MARRAGHVARLRLARAPRGARGSGGISGDARGRRRALELDRRARRGAAARGAGAGPLERVGPCRGDVLGRGRGGGHRRRASPGDGALGRRPCAARPPAARGPPRRHGRIARLCVAGGASLLSRRAAGDARPGRLGRAERDRAGGNRRRPARDDARPPPARQAGHPDPDPCARRREPRARAPGADRRERRGAPRRHAAARGVRLAGGRAGPRHAGAGRGDDADDAGAPCRAGLAAAVPDLARRPARLKRGEARLLGQPARAARPRGADLGALGATAARSVAGRGARPGGARRRRGTAAAGGRRVSYHVPAPAPLRTTPRPSPPAWRSTVSTALPATVPRGRTPRRRARRRISSPRRRAVWPASSSG